MFSRFEGCVCVCVCGQKGLNMMNPLLFVGACLRFVSGLWMVCVVWSYPYDRSCLLVFWAP